MYMYAWVQRAELTAEIKNKQHDLPAKLHYRDIQTARKT